MDTEMDGFKSAAEMMADQDADTEVEDAYSQPDAPGKIVNITEDGGVVKEIITPGSGWDEPESGDKVQVHYVGTLLDGTQFDSSRDRGEPFEFSLGQSQVIKGWDLGVATMKRGEKSKLTIQAAYGYGDAGSPPTIPGGATLVFEVELLSWKSVKDIAGDGGVIKTVLVEGTGWAKPQSRDEARVKFTARVQGADAPFYSSPKEGEEFELSSSHFCRAIATAAATMKKGEEARLVVKPEYGFGEQGRGAEVPPGATLEIDLTLLGWNKVENVTDDGAVVKKTLADTDEWKKPNAGSQVTVAYVGRLPDGTVFDEKTAEAPLTFTTDEDQAPCEGFELAVGKMKEGERALVTVPPQYAFGEAGSPQPQAQVPGGTTVQYDITLLSFVKAKDSWELDTAEKLTAAGVQKDKGNAAFKAGQYTRAVQRYKKAEEFVEYEDSFSADEKKAARELKRSVSLNLAAAHLKLGNAVEARKAADKVLEADGGNVKALYRRAQAYLATADFAEAELDIKRGLAEDPASSDFKLLARKLKQLQATAGKKEVSLYSGMMKALGRPGAKKAPAAGAEPPPTPEPGATAATENQQAAANGDAGAVPVAEAMEQP